jgi:hypothetical protein
MGFTYKGGYSARVKLRLIVGDHQIPLAQVGAKSCVAQTPPPSLPEQDAVVTVDIDGQVTSHNVHLLHGVSESSREIDMVCSPIDQVSRATQISPSLATK